MITVHVIFNAHLDPIWLWPWQAGMGEILATCRSVCDRLDRNPAATFTRGEAWVYKHLEKLDPGLFGRVCKHIEAGRWEIVGGWWIQPDCNLPSVWGMEKQIALGKEYFLERFGMFPKIAYNVDSFGHSAALPGLMRAAGQDKYIMMRPGEHEMHLPAKLFRWRGYEGGPEVTVFRIASSYNIVQHEPWRVKEALAQLPEGVTDTMLFMGIGDHGGGPTDNMIKEIQDKADAMSGVKLVFSSPSRFFNAIQPHIAKLPLVTGELQHHAVGCYSIQRSVKVGLRRAEHLLKMAELIEEGQKLVEPAEKRHDAWEKVCFTQFHDTMGGTCIPSAYVQIVDHLGFAGCVADDALRYGLERRLAALPDDPTQRLVLFNASDTPYDGYVEAEPWLQWSDRPRDWHVLDEAGRVVPSQRVGSEAACFGVNRVLLRLKTPAQGLRVLRLAKGKAPEQKTTLQLAAESIANKTGVAWDHGTMAFGKNTLPIRLDLIEDRSDTWTHESDHYSEGPAVQAQWNAPALVDSGPLMAAMIQTGQIGSSTLRADWRIYASEPFVELRLLVHWHERMQILKMTVPLQGQPKERLDGTMGGSIVRENTGKERPLRDWTLLKIAPGKNLGICCPDVFALDANPQRLRLTLLRSPQMAHHDPWRQVAPRIRLSDQGEHEFRFRFYCGKVSEKTLEQQAMMFWRPLVVGDLTRGMKPNSGWW